MNATSELSMPDTLLWPPIDEVRRALGFAVERKRDDLAEDAPGWANSVLSSDLPASSTADALRSLAETRAALAARPPAEHWQPGDIVAVTGPGGLTLGVVLDDAQQKASASGTPSWRGWLAVAETDWAGAGDVLLEPGDEPFDPAAGVVQTWNRVRLRECGAVPLMGQLSAARLASLRAVQDEGADSTEKGSSIAPRPGHIGLRSVNGFTVLTGTPLGSNDPRASYRALYQEAARQLAPLAATERTGAVPAAPWHRRIARWLNPSGTGRLALAGAGALVLALAVRGLYPALPPSAPTDDEVLFRSPADPGATFTLSVRWRDGADADAIAHLLRSFGGTVVGSPNAAGRWQLQVPDLTVAQRTLLASPLVAEVVGP